MIHAEKNGLSAKLKPFLFYLSRILFTFINNNSVAFFFAFYNISGCGVYFILILVCAGAEFDLVN